MNEFDQARAEMDKAIEREVRLGHPIPESMEIGAMLETPSLAFAPKRFTKRSIFYRSVEMI